MKTNYLLAAAFIVAINFSSCKHENKVPENPSNGDVYKDDNNNRWIWNAIMGAWMVNSMSGGHHYYYPTTNRWTNTGDTITRTRPSHVSTHAIAGVRGANYGTKPASSADIIKSAPIKAPRKSVFGSTGRSRSVFG